MKKVLVIAILFYFLVLFQTSFLVHFDINGYILNLVLILVVILSILKPPIFFKKMGAKRIPENFGIWGAFFGGFFLDIFSSRPIGFQILILLGLSFFIKLILNKYVRTPIFKRF
jgi:hypothetical protein